MSTHGRMRPYKPFGLLASGALGASAALLISCGSSGKLIPVANSEPLQKDFEEVAQAAEGGHGSCASTEAAIRKAERDYNALPPSLDSGLRRRLREGISKLRSDALQLCLQPGATTAQSTTAPRTETTTGTSSTPTSTPTTGTATTPLPTTTTPGPGGGTPAPKEGEGEEAGGGKRAGKGNEGEPGGAGGAGAGGEAGK